jgi:hypothetical protein
MNARRVLKIANWALRGALHTAPLPEPARVCVCNPCPCCGGSLSEGPHIHQEGVVWPTEQDDVILLTERDGSNPTVFYVGVR